MKDDALGSLVLGRYRAVRRLGQGGMGVVHLGRIEGAAGFAKPVVIKRIRSDIGARQDHTARFIREAHILAQLQHPCIVSVLDFGREGDGYAMVLEYMHGYDLACWLRYLQRTSTRLDWQEAVLILLRALDGLHYAHTFCRSNGAPGGVLHRDISPGNILLDMEGQVRLLDFGIARRLEDDAAQYQTREGVLSGKTGYLAPELFSGVPSSIASDIYACAVVLYYTLSGVHPFLSQSEYHTMWRVLEEVPPRLTSLRADLPPELDAVVFRSLAKQPAQRHPSALEFATELRKLLTRSEGELQLALRQRLRSDFTGAMPALLELEPLEQRERAWSAAQDAGAVDAPPLSSNQLSAVLREAPTAVDARPSAKARLSPPAAKLAASQTPAARRQYGWALGGGALLLAGGSILLAQQRGGSAPAEQRFIVVESPTAAASPTLAATSGAPAEGAAALQPPSAGAVSAAVARQLARRQAALQSCIQQELAGVGSGTVEATLHFDVAASGAVQAATLEPGTLESSPVGQCLLRVARETTFQGLQEGVRFSVPLRTRRGAQ